MKNEFYEYEEVNLGKSLLKMAAVGVIVLSAMIGFISVDKELANLERKEYDRISSEKDQQYQVRCLDLKQDAYLMQEIHEKKYGRFPMDEQMLNEAVFLADTGPQSDELKSLVEFKATYDFAKLECNLVKNGEYDTTERATRWVLFKANWKEVIF